MTDPLDIWILSDGKPGHENQSFGLAEATLLVTGGALRRRSAPCAD